jgi:hypothetical protein
MHLGPIQGSLAARTCPVFYKGLQGPVLGGGVSVRSFSSAGAKTKSVPHIARNNATSSAESSEGDRSGIEKIDKIDNLQDKPASQNRTSPVRFPHGLAFLPDRLTFPLPPATMRLPDA